MIKYNYKKGENMLEMKENMTIGTLYRIIEQDCRE